MEDLVGESSGTEWGYGDLSQGVYVHYLIARATSRGNWIASLADSVRLALWGKYIYL